jgi:hypothetical protein
MGLFQGLLEVTQFHHQLSESIIFNYTSQSCFCSRVSLKYQGKIPHANSYTSFLTRVGTLTHWHSLTAVERQPVWMALAASTAINGRRRGDGIIYLLGNSFRITVQKLCDICEGVSKSFRTGRLERELQMVQLSATKCSCIAILWVSLVSFTALTLRVAYQRVFIVVNVYFVIELTSS